MSLSLEYVGKFAIILVAVAIGVGLIVSLQSDVEGVAPDLGDDDLDSEIVDIDNDAAEVASLVRMCYSESRDRQHESFVCFMARSEDGSFSLSSGDIEAELDDSIAEYTEFPDDSFDRETIIIRYSVSSEAVVVEE